MRKLLITVALLWLFCLPVTANPVIIAGVGEIDFGPNITVTESQDNKGNTLYNFKVKDGDVWRGASLIFDPTDSPKGKLTSRAMELDILDKIAANKFSRNEGLVEIDKAKILQIDNKEAASISVKMTSPNIGFVITNMNMILLSTTDNTKILMFMCADGDAPFWRPVLYKIVSKIP